MQFLADVFVPCDQCDGKRFKPQVLEVKYRGRSIHQVLDLTVAKR
jgi:excinuclease ABC subunit A